MQYIDARDLAAWALTAAERQLGGPYNVVSKPGHATMEQLLDACVQVTGADAHLVWTDPETILAADIQPWTDLPIWLPPGEAYDTFHQANVSRAMGAGLQCRPILDTVADTWAWMSSPDGRPPIRTDRPSVGLDPEVEARVLASR